MARGVQAAGWTAVGVALLVGLAGSAGAETLTYVLSPEVGNGRIHVELTWETAGRTASTLCAAEHWGAVSDVPPLFKDVSFAGATLDEHSKADWQLRHRKGATVRARYFVDPGRREFNWDCLHYPIATEDFFHGVGDTFLLIPKAGAGDAPGEYDVVVRWKMPKDWKAVTSWATGPTIGARLAVDDLRHSVYLAGPLVIKHAPALDGNEVTVALLDRFKFQPDEFVKVAADIVGAECRFVNDRAFPPFVVTAIPVGEPMKAGQMSLSGTGLYRSFALFLPPDAPLTEGMDHLFAHELFHHWNGSVIQREEPEELVYWFSEGFTEYYALRILFESGRWDAETLAKWINRHVREYYGSPAKNATNETIKAEFWKQRDTIGEVPYKRGLLLALRWHRLAREHGVKDGLDKLLRHLIERGRAGAKVSNESLREDGRKLLGEWFPADFDRYVMRAETIELPADALAPKLTGALTTVYEFELGFERQKSIEARRVHGLVPNSAAAQAGLKEGDELAGWSIYSDADKEVVLKVKRDGEVETIQYWPRGKKSEVLQFSPAE